MAVWCSGYDTCLSPERSGFNSPNEQQQDILLFFPLRPFLSLPFSLPSQRNFPISFKPKVAIAKFSWKMQRKTWYYEKWLGRKAAFSPRSSVKWPLVTFVNMLEVWCNTYLISQLKTPKLPSDLCVNTAWSHFLLVLESFEAIYFVSYSELLYSTYCACTEGISWKFELQTTTKVNQFLACSHFPTCIKLNLLEKIKPYFHGQLCKLDVYAHSIYILEH